MNTKLKLIIQKVSGWLFPEQPGWAWGDGSPEKRTMMEWYFGWNGQMEGFLVEEEGDCLGSAFSSVMRLSGLWAEILLRDEKVGKFGKDLFVSGVFFFDDVE